MPDYFYLTLPVFDSYFTQPVLNQLNIHKTVSQYLAAHPVVVLLSVRRLDTAQWLQQCTKAYSTY